LLLPEQQLFEEEEEKKLVLGIVMRVFNPCEKLGN